jgi:hypothetical protein
VRLPGVDCLSRAGVGQILVYNVDDEPEQLMFGSQPRNMDFSGRSPLEANGFAFTMTDCPFPRSGRYSVQFWYNDRRIAEVPLELR